MMLCSETGFSILDILSNRFYITNKVRKEYETENEVIDCLRKRSF